MNSPTLLMRATSQDEIGSKFEKLLNTSIDGKVQSITLLAIIDLILSTYTAMK
jgi:hypothetical protein